MDLLIWRHAQAQEAEPGQNDLTRPLTPKGARQAKRMAHWLNQHLPAHALVCCSPAVRCVQTVEALGRDYQRQPLLEPNGRAQYVLDFLQWPPHPQCKPLAPFLLIVGHQPVLGDMLGKLLGQVKSHLIIKKGDVWWLRCEPAMGYRIRVQGVMAHGVLPEVEKEPVGTWTK